MRLLKDLIIKKKAECDEWTINSHYNPKGYYDIITICAIINKQPIKNSQEINQLYQQLQKYRLENNKRKIQETLNEIQKYQTIHNQQINIFLKEYQNINLTSPEHPEAYTKYSFAVLTYEEDDE